MGSLLKAQEEMRSGYANGFLGVAVSGVVWTVTSAIIHYYSVNNGIWALLIGGMLISPITSIFGKILGIKGTHAKDNPMGKLAMEGTIWMLMCIPLAYALSRQNEAWFFQGMAMIIGGRYLTFATVYGLRVYWVLGGALGVMTYILFSMNAGAFMSTGCVGIVELIFSVIIYIKYKSDKSLLQ